MQESAPNRHLFGLLSTQVAQALTSPPDGKLNKSIRYHAVNLGGKGKRRLNRGLLRLDDRAEAIRIESDDPDAG